MSTLYQTNLGNRWLWQCRRCDWYALRPPHRYALHACRGEKVRAGDLLEFVLGELRFR